MVWRIQAAEQRDLDQLWDDMTHIVWFLQHPPEMFMDPTAGTDNLRIRPRLDLATMLKISGRMRADLETLWLAHHPLQYPLREAGKREGKEWGH